MEPAALSMIHSETHKAARLWASRGVAVFPCVDPDKDHQVTEPHKKGKRPAVEGGFEAATTDLEQIDKWWSKDPNYNVGCSPDAAGCAVIDVDRPEALLEIETELGALPATFTVKTPRGGYHFWYKGELPPSTNKIAGKVDTRGKGSYVLLPPSRTGAGSYSYHDKRAPAPLPDWAMKAVGKLRTDVVIDATAIELDLPHNVARASKRAKTWPAGTADDAGDNAAYRHACEIREMRLSDETMLRILADWNNRCIDPMPEERLVEKIENSRSYRQNTEGAWAVPAPAETFAALVAKLPVVAPEPPRFQLLSEDEQDQLPAPTWIIPELLPAKQTIMLYAPSKSWKTFLALDWALSLAGNTAQWGPLEAGPVVYIAAEGAQGIAKSRRRAWKTLHGIEGRVPFYVIPRMPWVSDVNLVDEMCATVLATCRPKLIVIDTLARAMFGLDENASKDAGVFVEAMERIKRTLDCSVLALHHTKKDGSGYRGSGAIMAGFDSGLELVVDKETMLAEVWARWHKDADTRDHPWRLKAERVNDSLAFRMAEDSDRPVSDRLTSADIGEMLIRMQRVDLEHTIGTQALIFEVGQQKQWDSRKARRAFDALHKSGKLAAYEVRPGFYAYVAPSDETGF